jgi:pimeloyl-ACP methyl ester carboxylesterase
VTPEPVRLAARVVGSGPPVLVLHGLLGQGRNWQAIAKRLQGRFELHLLDLRNHGASPWSAVMDYPALAADLAAYLDARGLAEAALVGHSMGGKAAMALALTSPQRVKRLAVIDIAPLDYGAGQGFAGYLDAMLAIDPAGFARRAEVEAALADADPSPAIRAFLATNLAEAGGRLRWAANLKALRSAVRTLTGWPAGLGQPYPGPALFLHGAASDYVGEAALPAIRGLFPRAEIEAVPGAGHWVHAERPHETVAALGRFLGA